MPPVPVVGEAPRPDGPLQRRPAAEAQIAHALGRRHPDPARVAGLVLDLAHLVASLAARLDALETRGPHSAAHAMPASTTTQTPRNTPVQIERPGP